jgi:hypothetical protein
MIALNDGPLAWLVIAGAARVTASLENWRYYRCAMESDMNKIQAFHAAVGQFVVAWADLEQGLDFLALFSARTPGPRSGKVPRQLAPKVCFIRQGVDAIPHLREHKVGIIALLDEVQSLGQTRHDFVHGAAMRHFGRMSSHVTFTRLLQPPKQELRPEITVSIAEISKTADRVHELGNEVWDLLDSWPKTS